MTESQKPDCLICGKPVEGLQQVDVPYHVDCMVKEIEKRFRRKSEPVREYDEG